MSQSYKGWLTATNAAHCTSYPIPCQEISARVLVCLCLNSQQEGMQTDIPSSDQLPVRSVLWHWFSWHHNVRNVSSCNCSWSQWVLQVLSCPVPYPLPHTCPCEGLSEFSKREGKRDLGSIKHTLCLFHLLLAASLHLSTLWQMCTFCLSTEMLSGSYCILSNPLEIWRNEVCYLSGQRATPVL